MDDLKNRIRDALVEMLDHNAEINEVRPGGDGQVLVTIDLGNRTVVTATINVTTATRI
jgi:hypothetical protein